MKENAFSATEIEQARRLMGLGERASIKEIKTAYRKMCKRWHPDALRDDPEASKKMSEINAAYSLLLNYCESYRFSFSPEMVESFDPDKWWRRRFGQNIRSPGGEDKSE